MRKGEVFTLPVPAGHDLDDFPETSPISNFAKKNIIDFIGNELLGDNDRGLVEIAEQEGLLVTIIELEHTNGRKLRFPVYYREKSDE